MNTRWWYFWLSAPLIMNNFHECHLDFIEIVENHAQSCSKLVWMRSFTICRLNLIRHFICMPINSAHSIPNFCFSFLLFSSPLLFSSLLFSIATCFLYVLLSYALFLSQSLVSRTSFPLLLLVKYYYFGSIRMKTIL